MSEGRKRRLFFALCPGPEVLQGLLRIRKALKIEGGRRLHPEDIHVTLVFLGTVAPEQYACVLEAAGGVREDAFTLAIDHLEYWKRSRILWCGPTETPPALGRLVAQLQKRLESCAFTPEARPYRPHVTLARNSRRPPEMAVEQPVSWPVDDFALMETVAGGRDVPHYRVVRRWPLQPAP